MKKLNVAVVGLNFGGAFAEIYNVHPAVEHLYVFDTDADKQAQWCEHLGIQNKYKSFEDVLNDDTVDAVHLVTPIPLHAKQSVAVLEAGKHCACTVPMATSLEDIKAIIKARKKSGKNYMMMETTLYTYQYFYVKELIESGKLGKVQFLRGSHYQDMANWPDYWMGLPPMWYGTHAIGTLVGLSGSRIKKVHCFGSGTMAPELVAHYNNPFPVETAIFEFENGLKAEATRSLFETARTYQEGLFVYGSNMCFEWGFGDKDKPYVTTAIPATADARGGRATVEVIDLPNYYQLLPEEIQRFTVGNNFDPLNPHESLKTGSGGGHHGSHPHLVNEFINSILEERTPAIDEHLAANISGAGICAHISAMQDGKAVIIPKL